MLSSGGPPQAGMNHYTRSGSQAAVVQQSQENAGGHRRFRMLAAWEELGRWEEFMDRRPFPNPGKGVHQGCRWASGAAPGDGGGGGGDRGLQEARWGGAEPVREDWEAGGLGGCTLKDQSARACRGPLEARGHEELPREGPWGSAGSGPSLGQGGW